MNKISIIVPIYNSEKFLEACLTSLVNQVYENLEVILVDDGSTDSSFKIAKSFAEKDARFKLFKKENGGQASARNLGLNEATGDFIAFVDSDDTISQDFFQENINYFINNPSLDIVQVPVFFNYGGLNENLKVRPTQKITDTANIFKHWIENGDISWILCDKIFKRSLFIDIRFKEGMVYEDNFLLVDILRKTSKFYISNQGIYYYHHRLGSTTLSPHSLKKELDTQTVSLHIFSALMDFRNIKTGKLKIFSRIVNVYLSQISNYNIKVLESIPDNITGYNFLISTLYQLHLPVKEKVKLLIIKFLGVKNFLKLFIKIQKTV